MIILSFLYKYPTIYVDLRFYRQSGNQIIAGSVCCPCCQRFDETERVNLYGDKLFHRLNGFVGCHDCICQKPEIDECRFITVTQLRMLSCGCGVFNDRDFETLLE